MCTCGGGFFIDPLRYSGLSSFLKLCPPCSPLNPCPPKSPCTPKPLHPLPSPVCTPDRQGHMILLGKAGSGRRTLARLSAHVSKCVTFEAILKDAQKGFNWKDMLKQALHTAGVLGRCVGGTC